MMMPGMIQQAMAAGQSPTAAPAPPKAAPAPAQAGAAAVAAGGPDFNDLAPVTKDPKAMVRSVAVAAGYTVEESGDLWRITVPIGPLRKQVVTVEFGRSDDQGHAVVATWSACGPAVIQNAHSLLKHNTNLLHGAFAVRSVQGRELVVLQANHLAETLDPLEVSRTLSAIAWQADKVEEKLTGGDEN